MPKNSNLENYLNSINSFFEKNKALFVTYPVIQKKSINANKKVYYSLNATVDQIFIKSNYSKNQPFIEFSEEWRDDHCYSYSYRLVIPFFNFVYAQDGPKNDTRLKRFEYRYENHPDKAENTVYPRTHLHIFDNLLPHYSTNEICFFDFFKIIETEFIKSKKLEFEY